LSASALIGQQPEAGDRVAFDTGQMQGAGFLVAVADPSGTKDPMRALCAICVIGVPQMLMLPMPCVRTLEHGALVRTIISPLSVVS
jgi:hypothetical protein